LILGDEEKELTLEGESLISHKTMMIGEYIPFDNVWHEDIPVNFNIDYIDIPCIATHSHTVRMIIMYNNSLQIFAYEWERFVL